MDLYTIIQDAKRQWGVETVQAILNKIAEEDLVWQGNLRDSVGLNQDDTLDGNITFKMADYGHYLDQGVNGTRSAYATGFRYSGDPEQIRKMGGAISKWATAKGLNPWAVANSLQKKGLRPRRFFNDVIESRLPNLAVDIEKAYATYLTDMINNQQKR